MTTAGGCDRVFRNGTVITLDSRSTVASSIALIGDRILAVGDDAAIASSTHAGTEITDLRGRIVMPGLIDGHAHLDREGLKDLLPSLQGARSIDALVRRLREVSSSIPPGEWIVTMPLGVHPEYRSSASFFAEGRLPDRYDLDRASTDHPILIRAAWGYWSHQTPIYTIANSRALELAEIGKNTESPSPNVKIERDEGGNPTGIISESGPMPLAEFTLFRKAPNFTAEDRVRTLGKSMRTYNAYGTTTIFEGHGSSPEVVRAYQRLRERNGQSVRAHLVFSPAWSGISAQDVTSLIASWGHWLSGRGLGDEWLRVAGIYTEIDESQEGRLRARCFPQTGWAGFCYDSGLPRTAVKELLLEAARQGIRVSGIWQNLLELFTDVNGQCSIAGQRWVLGHQTFLDQAQIARIRDMGLVLTTHTQIHKRGSELLSQAGSTSEDNMYPMRSLLDAGVPISLGTDNVPPSIFYSIWEVTERTDSKSGVVVAPGQKISREEALRCATAHGAYLCFEEDQKGSLEPGKLADLVIFDENPLDMDPHRLRHLSATMTVVGGRTVYERAPMVETQ